MSIQQRKRSMVYMNGELVPSGEAKISIFCAGFQRGYSVFDVTRTFKHKIFRLNEHIDRLYCSVYSARIEVGMSKEKMKKAAQELVDHNLSLIRNDQDLLIDFTITQDVGYSDMHVVRTPKPIVIINTRPLRYEKTAKFYKIGAHAVTVPTRAIPAQCLDPRIKCRSRMHFSLALVEARAIDPDAFSILLDINGNITESRAANFFIVKNGTILTPPTEVCLEGINRRMVLDLAKEENVRAFERNIVPYDVYNAEEAFLTSTTLCVLPVSRFNFVKIGNGVISGPITERLQSAWSKKVGMDIIEQALSFLDEKERRRLEE